MLWPSWVKFWNTSNQLDHTRCESFIHLKRTNDLPHAFIRVNFTVHSQFTLKYLLLHYHPVNFSFYLLLVHPTTFNFYSVRDSFNLLYSYFFFNFQHITYLLFFFQFHLVELVLFIYGTLPMIYFVTLLHYAAVWFTCFSLSTTEIDTYVVLLLFSMYLLQILLCGLFRK